MKLDKPYFMGWDWLELAKEWNLYIPDNYSFPGKNDFGFDEHHYDYDPVNWFILSVLSKYNGVDSTRPMKKIAGDCRLFLSKLGDEDNSSTYSWPLWDGMSKIEDDWTLLNFVYPLIGYMWD
jgi:hypothetical protein